MEEDEGSGLLLFNQINTRYATDATNMQVWFSHYDTCCAFVALDGPVVLFDYSNHPYLTEGLEVEVMRGPLKRARGIIVRKECGHQLILSVRLIQQAVSVAIDASDVTPI